MLESNHRRKGEKIMPILTHKQMTQALIPMMKILGIYQEFKYLMDKQGFYTAKKLIDKANEPARKRLAKYAKENKEKGGLIAR